MTKLANLLSEIQEIETSKLSPNPLNPHRVDKDKDYDETMKSIKDEGIVEPLIAKRDGVLLSGHKRLHIARTLRLKKVPVRYCEREFKNVIEEKNAILLFNVFRREYTMAKRIQAYVDIFGVENVYEEIKHLPITTGKQGDRQLDRVKYFHTMFNPGKNLTTETSARIAEQLNKIFENTENPIQIRKNKIEANKKKVRYCEQMIRKFSSRINRAQEEIDDLENQILELEKQQNKKNNSKTKVKK